MKALQTGSQFKIYDDSLWVHDQLPVATYSVAYTQQEGCFLLKRPNICVSEKAYGVHTEKLEKVLNSFQSFSRSLGVILSGDKGIGKSMFAKMVCASAIQIGRPVIIVSECVRGLAQFLESIEQECVVLFDEFDKIFRSNKQTDDQAALLSLFDGTAGGKKLFIVTCNELSGLNSYIVNRPGRFHYHFRFDYPEPEAIRDYLRDNLSKEYHKEIEKVVDFSRKVSLNYDCLRAIAFELNSGSSFASAIIDLNIMTTDTEEYVVYLYLDNGVRLHQFRYKTNLYDIGEGASGISMYNDAGNYVLTAYFNKRKIVYDISRKSTVVPAEGISLDYSDNDDDDDDDKAKNQKVRNAKPLYMSFTKKSMPTYHYVV